MDSILDNALSDTLISRNEYQYMNREHPKMACFYATPKIHKGISPLKGRPIVSGIGNLTQNIGEYVGEILRPFV